MEKIKIKNKAFTLIELLVVIVIIGILAGMGVSQFNDYKDKALQGKSYALQGQIDKIISADCIDNNYSCGKNLVPNWAFSEGDNGDWTFDSASNGLYFEIKDYKLYHAPRAGSNPTSADYIVIPINEPLEANKVYRVDVIARDIESNGSIGSGGGRFIGFSSLLNTGIGHNASIYDENSGHTCDVFSPTADGAVPRLFVTGPAEAYFDEISLREVIGYTDINNNNDCGFIENSIIDS